MMQHGVAGISREAVLAESLRFVRPARIERDGGAANQLLGSLSHARIRAKKPTANNLRVSRAYGLWPTTAASIGHDHLEPIGTTPLDSAGLRNHNRHNAIEVIVYQLK